MRTRLPRESGAGDYSRDMADKRRAFVEAQAGITTRHIGQYSFDPAELPGNIELFSGVAQIPVGFAGPLLINGEHARGEFFIPLATTEGTLVASYNRGMKLIHESGGVTTTILDDAMQRAPVFHFENARKTRDFGLWITEHFKEIKDRAESTTRSGKLKTIEQYPVGKLMYLRFNYSTGDAAGQNMVGKATFEACRWITSRCPDIVRYVLSGNMDTDKKPSRLNMLHSRGKRVTAEITIPAELMKKISGASVDLLVQQRQVSSLGAFLAGSNNNGSHAANGITAMFIACGQDAANVAESCAGLVYVEKTPSGDYYFSITLPSLIVATHGGGTGLSTQREYLELLGCHGPGKAPKFTELVAGTVLAGELSLASAVLAGDWVSSHDKYGRNR
ncbi:hydroxymethylglutaryl-CoA reductase [Desulfatiferula olefinivorans]